jgi:hypothetical protein
LTIVTEHRVKGVDNPEVGLAPPEAIPDAAAITEPSDEPYCGTLLLHVDATDLDRRIYRVRQIIPVQLDVRTITLLYPRWLPGFHAPQAPIELFAGLTVMAGDEILTWKRHPVTVNAFDIEVPDGIRSWRSFSSCLPPIQRRVALS